MAMAPEQARGETVDARADVYALGGLLCFLLCGRYPIDVEGTTVLDALRRITEHEPILPSRVEPALRAHAALDWICLRALEKAPDDRYRSVDELADDVRRFLEHRPVRARRSPWAYRAGLFLRRHRRGVAAAATLASVFMYIGRKSSSMGHSGAGRGSIRCEKPAQ